MDPMRVYRMEKRSDRIWIVLGVAFVVIALFAILISTKAFPRKGEARRRTEADLEQSVNNSDVSLQAVELDRVETKRFKTRAQDPVGFFDYLENPHKVVSSTGKEYGSWLAYYRGQYPDYDPEAGAKWAYIVTGSYEAQHKEEGKLEGQFRLVYVEDINNNWRLVSKEIGPSEDALRQAVTGQVVGYVLASYEVQPNVTAEITYIETQRHNNYYTYYTVYGIVTAKDKYGEVYTAKFTAEYESDDYDRCLEKKSLTVEDMIRKR